MVQEVTLEIAYEADDFDAPATWDWRALTEERDVAVVEAGDPRPADPASRRASKGGEA
jgi:hypothetical protein